MWRNKIIRDRARAPIVFVGQFPPPVNGLTFVTSRLASMLVEAGYEVAIADVSGSGGRSPLFHASRSVSIFRALVSIAAHAARSGGAACYLTADGGLGLVYSILIAAFARLCGFRVFIHHHSHAYIAAWRPLMRLLLGAAGARAVHICLSEGMARDLGRRYRRDMLTSVLSNAAFVGPVAPAIRCAAPGDLTIGLLGNLTPEKGLYAFIEIIRLARERGPPVRGVLAGPIAFEADRAFLASLSEELAGLLEYRGAVHGADKARFYRDVDVFVFPTSYRNEAQPMVLFESLANGVPVISFDRGCIREQVADAGFLIEPGADFVAEALLALDRYRVRPALLAAHRRVARSRYEEERRTGKTRLGALFDGPPVALRGRFLP